MNPLVSDTVFTIQASLFLSLKGQMHYLSTALSFYVYIICLFKDLLVHLYKTKLVKLLMIHKEFNEI